MHLTKPKIERQRKTKAPCSRCFLHLSRCICAFIPSLETKTRLSLIVHAKELKRTTNTGRLAVYALKNSQMLVRGDHQSDRVPLDLSSLLDSSYHTLLFYPSNDAIELTTAFVQSLTKPIHLLVPDGSWRQASKVATRHKELANVTRVKISLPNLATQHLRAESFSEGMSTLQAIAQAFRVLESEKAYEELNQLYTAKLNATLLGRGKLIVS